ncbi:MAG: hypothetical protein LQ346_001454 [Caloplaca aetnensis]|nr:MAG: hypothetical protein LQ346_001454 [Caloplaca aetnensis]
MTRKVINPPRAVPTTSSTTCPTCGSHPQSQAYTLPDPASTTGSVGITEDDPWVRKYSELSPEFSSLLAGRFLDQEHLMGLSYNVYLNSDKIFGCKNCKTHLASHDTIISRNFRGQHGKAFLFSTVVNTTQSEAVERNMTTGRHQVRDVNCKQCKETVGWKYDKAYEASEKYKEGKFILEAELLCQVY